MGRRKWVGSLDNVLRFFDRHVSDDHMTEGVQWYVNARREAAALAMVFGVDITLVVGMQSAYSANAMWNGNRTAVYRNLERIVNGEPVRGMRPTVGWINAMLQGVPPMEALQGNKLRDFYGAILTGGQWPNAVIDRWMARVYLGMPEWSSSVGDALYRDAQDAFNEAADLLGFGRSPFQAGVWVAVRGSGD